MPHVAAAAAGDLLALEIERLSVVLEPERPLLCLLGGAKVSDKLGILEALAPHADVLAVGGAMAYTFLAARGEPVGRSLVEAERMTDAKRIMSAAEASGRKLLLPTDHIVATAFDAPESHAEQAGVAAHRLAHAARGAGQHGRRPGSALVGDAEVGDERSGVLRPRRGGDQVLDVLVRLISAFFFHMIPWYEHSDRSLFSHCPRR